MSPLRIAVALPHLGVYGGIRRFLELGRVWTARGHDVALVTPDPARAGSPWLPFGGRVIAPPELGLSSWDALLSPDPALFLALDAPGATRVYYSVLEGAPEANRAWRRADVVLANSAGMRRWLARRGVRAVDAAGGVNLEFFHPPDPDPRAERARSTAPVRALVFGRLSRRRKGTWTAARAVERAAIRSGIATELTLFDSPVAGSGEPALPGPLAIPHRWVLNPSQDELAALYRETDLFVSAERRAGWCNTAAEAMASGVAVACTRSGTEDFAVDGETAAVSWGPWTWALSRQVAALLENPARRLAVAARGRARIAEFSWERTADRIERAIRERIGEGTDARIAS